MLFAVVFGSALVLLLTVSVVSVVRATRSLHRRGGSLADRSASGPVSPAAMMFVHGQLMQ